MSSDASTEKDLKAGAEQKPLNKRPKWTPAVDTDFRSTLYLAVTSLGIIYGDIGTSPLYVLNAIFPSDGDVPSQEDIIGAISAVLYSLLLVPTLKYCIIALQFGNNSNEGGPMAMYSALYPPVEDSDDNRTMTTYPTMNNSIKRASLFESTWVRRILLGWVLFGTSLTISDGLLTPAVSVVSAVQGIAVASPSVGNSTIPISVAILVVLFLFQALGTQRVGLVFAPIVGTWLALIAVSGCINIATFPGIFRAFDPSRAILWFVRTKNFDNLAGVLLCITGVEAMLANLGQFSKGSIRLGFLGYVLPALILAYLGQGAKLITDTRNVLPNVFFNSVPGGVGSPFWWITFVFAILAAVIASQAMISATFSLTQQLVHFHSVPMLKIIHTSSYFSGQVFVPVVNILIFLGTIGFTVGFGTSSGLTNAYGFAVSTVLIVTTTFIAISMVRIKHLPIALALAFLVGAGFIDGLFWGASLKKIPEGAYAPLAIGCALTVFFLFWSWARGLEDSFDANNRHRLTDIISRPPVPDADNEKHPTEIVALSRIKGDSGVRLRVPAASAKGKSLKQSTAGDVDLQRLPVFALFHNVAGNSLDGAPHSFAAFLRCYPSLPQVIVFFSILVLRDQAYTEGDDERFAVSRVRSFDGMYICKYRVGYRDIVDLTNVAQAIRDRIVSLEASYPGPNEAAEDDGSRARHLIAQMDAAISQSVTHIVPHFHISAEKTGNRVVDYIRRFLLEGIYRRIQSDETAAYVLNEEDVLRMGVSCQL